MTSSDEAIFITRDAVANQILEFGVQSNPDFDPQYVRDEQNAQYARDLAEHLMSEFIVLQTSDDDTGFVETGAPDEEPSILTFEKPASNGRVKSTDTITIHGVTYPLPVNRDYRLDSSMTTEEVYLALGIDVPEWVYRDGTEEMGV